jgi:DNA polymerase-3 subunit delta'
MKHVAHPRTTYSLIGLRRQESRLLEQWYDRRLPHACLFTGPQGVGKATLAYRLARFILSGEGDMQVAAPSLFGDALPPLRHDRLEVSPEHPAAHRIAAGTHPDLLVLEPPFDEKKGVYKSEIPVDAVRGVGHFLSQTSSEGGWKIVLIDPVDALNANAANALLKWLEEPPPQCLFLLISHQPGGVLPTIISRCQVVGFSLQAPEDFAALLADRGIHASDADMPLLQRLSGGSAGLAASLHEQHAEAHYHEMLDLMAKGNDPALVHFAERLTGGKDAPHWDTIERLVAAVLSQIIKLASGMAAEVQNTREIDVLKALSARKSLDYWLDLWENGTRMLRDAEHLHLSKKHALLSVLLALCGKGHVAEALRLGQA